MIERMGGEREREKEKKKLGMGGSETMSGEQELPSIGAVND